MDNTDSADLCPWLPEPNKDRISQRAISFPSLKELASFKAREIPGKMNSFMKFVLPEAEALSQRTDPKSKTADVGLDHVTTKLNVI